MSQQIANIVSQVTDQTDRLLHLMSLEKLANRILTYEKVTIAYFDIKLAGTQRP